MRIVVLFTRDLRVHDHPALWEACRRSDDVVPLFVVDPDLIGVSENRARFLTECLVDLDRALAHRGGRLLIREGDAAEQAARLAVESGSGSVFLTRDVGVHATRRVERLRALCRSAGIAVREFPGHAVVEPGDVVPAGRAAYHVFTPYLKAWSAFRPRPVLDAPAAVHVPAALDAGRLPDPSRHRPTAVDLPTGGGSIARRRLRTFLATDLADYARGRDDPAADLTSRLSPYLRFGCISAVEVAGRVNGARTDRSSAIAFVRQLAWRDYFLQRLAETPSMSWADLRSPPTHGPAPDPDVLEAWTEGRTGVPIVDAGMRQLAREGWMHNRVRLVAASFLTRIAGHRWQDGARHFARHLVDGDPSNNAGNWQWVAGTGVSARRGRALDPVRQAERFDPTCEYVRRYVPELVGLDGDAIRRPWRDPEILRSTGYPAPAIALERPDTEAATRSAAARRSVPR
jgi:deoxyribodipyrimidine photo-lyase